MLKYVFNNIVKRNSNSYYRRCFSINSSNTNDDGFYKVVSLTSQVSSLTNEIYGEIIDYAIGNTTTANTILLLC